MRIPSHPAPHVPAKALNIRVDGDPVMRPGGVSMACWTRFVRVVALGRRDYSAPGLLSLQHEMMQVRWRQLLGVRTTRSAVLDHDNSPSILRSAHHGSAPRPFQIRLDREPNPDGTASHNRQQGGTSAPS